MCWLPSKSPALPVTSFWYTEPVLRASTQRSQNTSDFFLPLQWSLADTSTRATVSAQVRGVGKTSKAKARGEAGSQGAAGKCIRKRPAAAGVSLAAGTSTAALGKGKRPRESLDARYPWGREGGPPPASEAERQSLADQLARLRIEAANLRRPGRADAERLARAEAMLHIMRSKARASFGGGRAMATHGMSLNRSEGLALAKRAMTLARDLEAHFDPEGTPSVLIEEGMAATFEFA